MSVSSDLSSTHDRHESTAALVKDFQSVQGSHLDLQSQRQRSHSRFEFQRAVNPLVNFITLLHYLVIDL